MKDYLDFTGKTAIVIGGRRGLGRAMSIAFAERGAKVAVVARSQDGSEILNELETSGTKGLYYCCDVGDKDARKGLIEKIVNDLGGRLDILVNDAGMQYSETIESCTEEHWQHSEAVLLDAPYDFSRQAIPFMKKQNYGKIILISSICAVREGGYNFSYGVMKAGLASMARCMANAIAQYNITVNAIAPGIIRTPLTVGQGCFEPERYARIISQYPARRLGEPEEIASAALFLASDMSSFVNGHMLFVDGGFTGN